MEFNCNLDDFKLEEIAGRLEEVEVYEEELSPQENLDKGNTVRENKNRGRYVFRLYPNFNYNTEGFKEIAEMFFDNCFRVAVIRPKNILIRPKNVFIID